MVAGMKDVPPLGVGVGVGEKDLAVVSPLLKTAQVKSA